MRRLPLMLLLVLAAALWACSDDDEGTPTGLPDNPDLQAMAECAAVGIKHLGYAVQASVVLFHILDEPGYVAPADFHYDPATGAFDFAYALDTGAAPTRIDGTVATLATVGDGLDQGDIFTVAWTLRPQGANQDVAAGAFRVIHQGYVGTPQTETMRMIPADDIWCGPVGGCRTEFTQLEVHVHHLLAADEIQTALASFTCSGAGTDTLTGAISAGATAAAGSIYGIYQGVAYNCTFDMDTYAVDCSGN